MPKGDQKASAPRPPALVILPDLPSTNYAVPQPWPASEECPVHVRFLKPHGVELALYLKRLPALGSVLRVAADNDQSALVREAALVVVALMDAEIAAAKTQPY